MYVTLKDITIYIQKKKKSKGCNLCILQNKIVCISFVTQGMSLFYEFDVICMYINVSRQL